MTPPAPWRRALLLVAALCACASGPPRRPAGWHQGDRSYAVTYLDWMIRREMARRSIRGLSIAVVDDHRTLFERGYGYADAGQGIAATPDTVYRIGSVSKVVTAALVMSLVERGQLDLDAPVTAYEPSFTIHSRFAAAPITLREVLSHHAGLPANVTHGMWVDAPAPLSSVTTLLADESLVSPPGTMFHYSNIGFAFAGRIVENVTHQPFAEAAQRTLFDPLGMTSSSFESDARLAARLAVGYLGDRVIAPTPLRDVSAGSMLSTAGDLGRFLQMMLARGSFGDVRVLSPESVATLLTPQFEDRALDLGHRVALDWVTGGPVVRGVDEPVSWHNGYAPPFDADVSLLRDARLGVVVLSNTAQAGSAQIAARALELMREVDTGVAQPEPEDPEDPEVPAARSDLDALAGEYVGLGAQTTTIRRDGRRLHAQLFGRDLELIPTGPRRFVPRATVFFGLFGRTLANLTLSFEHVEGRDFAVLRGGATHVVFERLSQVPIPEAWRRRAGPYTVETSGESFTFTSMNVAADHGALTLSYATRTRHPGGPVGAGDTIMGGAVTLRLIPVSDDEAIVAGVDQGETVRAARDAQGETLHYSGFVLRR